MVEAGGHINPEALERSLGGLRRSVHRIELKEALREVLHGALELFDVTGTGLMVIDEGRVLCSVAATDEPGRLLEETQERVGHGPCVDALVYDTVTQVPDLAEDDRWPELKPELPDRGVRAVLGVPVHVAGETVGALNCYVDKPRDWSESEVRALQAYADLVGSLLASAVHAQHRSELADQLQHALNSRVVIERAVGMLMGRHDIDAVTAFNRLRRAARDRSERVAALAERVLRGHNLDRD
ncbi:MAG TPA: GAF and ANTAR domain-containing protein [Capillimicrobium sp.]|nr:GAF and ANTAR domain-containing protein [Capillimicrobium sp.]